MTSARAGLAEALVDHHRCTCDFGVLEIGGNHDALARREAVGLQHDRKRKLAASQDRDRLRGRVARSISRRRHVAALHEFLREHFARLEPRGALRRTEQQIAFGCEHVGDAAAERQLRADDREIDLFASGDLGDGMRISGIDGNAPRYAADAGISRRANDVRRRRVRRPVSRPGRVRARRCR